MHTSNSRHTSFDPVSFLRQHYSLHAQLVRLPEGKMESSDVFIISTEEKGNVVLKASHWYQGFVKNPVEVLEDIYKVVDELSKCGVPIQRAYKNRTGSFVTEAGGLPWVLLSYTSGKPFSAGSAGISEWIAAGKALGLFHKVGSVFLKETPSAEEWIKEKIPVEKPYEESRDLYLFGGFREKLLSSHVLCDNETVCDAVRDAVPLLDIMIEYVEEMFKNGGILTASVLHNDFNYANGLYRDDGSFAGFLDADQFGVGPCVYDLGNTLASFATEFLKKGTQEAFQERAAAFLSIGYHSVFPLQTGEYLLILAATERWDVMRVLRTMRRHHFEEGRLPELVPKVANRFLPRIQSAPQTFSFITKKWLSQIGLT